MSSTVRMQIAAIEKARDAALELMRMVHKLGMDRNNDLYKTADALSDAAKDAIVSTSFSVPDSSIPE